MGKIGKTPQELNQFDPKRPDSRGLGRGFGVDDCLPVDGIGHHDEFVVASDDEFGVVVPSKPKHEPGVVDGIVVPVQFEGLFRFLESLIEEVFRNVVEPSLLTNHVEGRLVLVDPKALRRLQLHKTY